jgi:hypothetical protein
VTLSSGSTLRSKRRIIGCRAEGFVGEETARGGNRKRAKRRAGKEACCSARGGEGTQTGACSPCEDSNGGESKCIEEGKVVLLHSVVCKIC